MKKRTVSITLVFFCTVVMILSFVMSYQSTPASSTAATQPEIRLSSDFFNPDRESLTIYLPPVLDMPQVLSWRVEVLESKPPYFVFYDWVGRGLPPPHIVWDGRNSGGEQVHSATDYPLVYYLIDVNGNIKTIETKIKVGLIMISNEAFAKLQF